MYPMQQRAVIAEPLTREKAMRALRAREQEIRARGVTRLALFGSTVRNEARGDSDVDLLVDIDSMRKFSLFDWAGLESYFRELFGREVEVTIRRNLKAHVKGNIFAEAVEVFPVFGRGALDPGGVGMPARTRRERLQDILDAIAEIESLTAGMSLEQLRTDAKTRRAVERDIEIISEASRHLTVDDERNHPEIPWHQIRATGNVFRHLYERIDPDVVWSILTKDLGPLKAAVTAMMAEADTSQGA
jgi:uncharacterized protein with HEPN domain/predicted nucleotidyltransferase